MVKRGDIVLLNHKGNYKTKLLKKYLEEDI